WPGIAFAMASCSAYITMKGIAVAAVSAGSNHVGAKETCTPKVSCPPGWAAPAEPVERKTPEPASAPEIFRISRRLRSLTAWIVILGPFCVGLGINTAPCGVAPRKVNSAHHRNTIGQIAADVQWAALQTRSPQAGAEALLERRVTLDS